jgi:hypothetical protein
MGMGMGMDMGRTGCVCVRERGWRERGRWEARWTFVQVQVQVYVRDRLALPCDWPSHILNLNQQHHSIMDSPRVNSPVLNLFVNAPVQGFLGEEKSTLIASHRIASLSWEKQEIYAVHTPSPVHKKSSSLHQHLNRKIPPSPDQPNTAQRSTYYRNQRRSPPAPLQKQKRNRPQKTHG